MLPHLIHPITCLVDPIDTAGSTFDRAAREPIRGMTARKPAVEIQAQVGDQDPPPDVLPSGLRQKVRGYLIALKIELDLAGYTPAPGDRITRMGWRTVTAYVVHVGYAGHYPDQDGASLVRIYYGDREGD